MLNDYLKDDLDFDNDMDYDDLFLQMDMIDENDEDENFEDFLDYDED